MPQIVWHVGDVVMKLREARRWNQDRLRVAAGVHRTTIVDVESNAEGVTRRTYEKIAKALNVSLRDMYALVPAPTAVPDRASERETDAAVAETRLSDLRRQIRKKRSR